MYATTTRGPSPVALPNIYDDETLVGAPTPSPTPALIPLPPSDTRTVASTRVASPDYMPRTPSPVNYWMPEDEDIQGDMGTAAEHATFVAARRFNFGLSWSGAIHMNRRANPRGPPALPVRTIAITLSRTMIFNPLMGQVIIRTHEEPAQPTPLPALTQQQLQWLEEDLRAEMPLPTLPSYHSRAMTETRDNESIPALALVLEDEDREEAQTPAPDGPIPGVHPGLGWFRNANEETGSPIFSEYVLEDGLEIIAPYYQFDMDTDSPELLLTRGRRCTVHSRTLRARKDPYPHPALTRKQRYSFEADQPFSRLVDWALDQEEDDTLKAEVTRYRAMTKRASCIANHIAALREDLANVTQQCFQSAKSLADANAYYRIAPRVIYSTPPAEHLTDNQVHHARNFFDDPWADRPRHNTLLCSWCGTDDHNVEDCKPLTKCEYCGRWGHCSDFCRTPHDACSINEPCRILRQHARWGLHTCPSDVRVFHA
jgi:hypothetical protein